MPFKSLGGDVRDIFVSETELIERFTGKQLWTWGLGSSGQLGNNTVTNTSSPVQTISGGNNWQTVSAGSDLTAAIKVDGSLWTWGLGNAGRLGNGTTSGASSPVQTISGGNNWRNVSVKSEHTAATKTDGTLWLWGPGFNGKLGDNTTAFRNSPVQTISGGTNWRTVSAGGDHTAAIKTDGTLWLWGLGDNGLLGDNSTISKSSPVQTISGGTNWRSVSVSDAVNHTAAIKTDGSLWVWGSGSSGRLGTNTITNQSSPVQTISGGTNWRIVASGGDHTAAIKTDGSLWVWGSGSSGQLGNNTLTNQSSPVQTISGGTNWRSVDSGCFHTSAIKTDGSLWVWGSGSSGQLGSNTLTNQSSPIQTISGGTNWRTTSAGGSHTAATRLAEF